MIGLLSSIRDGRPRSTKSHSTTSASSTIRSPSSISTLDDLERDINATVKGRPPTFTMPTVHSTEELHLLAISAQITEVCYSISDIQTRIFEIQELRHQATSNTASSAVDNGANSDFPSGDIDRALMSLDERLESVSDMIQVIEDALEPILAFPSTPTKSSLGDEESAEMLVLRKHHEMMDSWEEVQKEGDELKEELREDKWLAVFRTVSSQADDMMSSLEKAVTQCHDFIWQVNRPDGADNSGSSLLSPGRISVNMEVFNSILQAYESKKKYYVPATTKVISVIDKGMRDRATKNGECLRRHAEMRARWRNLRERMSRIDNEMEGVRTMLLQRDGRDSSDEEGSMVSRQTTKSKVSTSMLSTTSSRTPRHHSTSSAISRSISPFRRLAARMGVGSATPAGKDQSPGSDTSPPVLRKRSSYFSMRPSAPGTPEPKRKSILAASRDGRGTPLPGLLNQSSKKRWNSSTRVDYDTPGDVPTKTTPPKRRPSSPTSSATHTSAEPTPTTTSGRRPSISGPSRLAPRSVSGPAMLSPSSPLSSVGSPTTPARHPRTSTPTSHSKKRSISSSRPVTPPPPVPPLPSSLQGHRPTTPSPIPRPRPQSPSHIPGPTISRANTPVHHFFGGDLGEDSDNPPTTLMQRALSPTFSTVSASGGQKSARRASSSRLPLPTFQVTASQPPSPTTTATVTSRSPGSAAPSTLRPQTPEVTLRARAQQMPFYQTPTTSRSGSRPPTRNPPSSYKDSASVSGRTTPSRPSSRSTSYDRTAVFSPSLEANPVPEYTPIGPNDPLDVEVARTVNNVTHGFLVERIDPIPRTAPQNKDYKAQYAISNSVGRKTITCRLVTIARSARGGAQESVSRKVMVRVGGGWQDLDIYLLNRQASSL